MATATTTTYEIRGDIWAIFCLTADVIHIKKWRFSGFPTTFV